MTFISVLARTNAIALAALLAVALALAAMSAAFPWLSPSSALGVTGSARVVFLAVLLLGAPLVIGFGAPLYALFWHRGSASWLTAAVLGCLPGLIALGFDLEIGAVALVCGSVVAFSTHAFWSAGPNYSLKRTDQSLRD